MKSKELREKRQRLHEDMVKLRNEATDQLNMDQFDRMNNDFSDLTRQIEAAELIEQRELEMAASYQTSVETRQEVDNKEATNRAWGRLILNRGELSKLSDAERVLIMENKDPKFRANQQGLTAGTGGYTVPQGFMNELAIAELYYNNFETFARVIRTDSGNDMPWPKTNDSGVVAYQINEATSLETSATAVTFTSQTLKAFKWTSGMVRIASELLTDSAFDLNTVMADLFAERMGRGLAAAYTTGAGTTTIQGIVTGAAASGITAAASALTRANLVDLIHTVDVAYRRKPSFGIMMHDSTMKAIRKLSVGDTDDTPLYQVSAMAGQPDTIEGVPVYINNAMAAIGANNKSIVVGDFKNYVIRRVNGDTFKILTERFADTDEIGLVLLRRVDGQVVNAGTNPIKYMVHAGS